MANEPVTATIKVGVKWEPMGRDEQIDQGMELANMMLVASPAREELLLALAKKCIACSMAVGFLTSEGEE